MTQQLEAIASEGFTDSAIEAAINTIEFSLRENNTGSFPRGLSLMLRAMASWIYDKDPFQPLQWTRDLEHFKVSALLPQTAAGLSLRHFMPCRAPEHLPRYLNNSLPAGMQAWGDQLSQ